VTAWSLNVRSGAGATTAIRGTLSQGDTVVLLETATATNGDVWGRILFEGSDGWISLKHTQYVPTRVAVIPTSHEVVFWFGSQVVQRTEVLDGSSVTAPPLPERTSQDPTLYVWVARGWDSNGDNVADVAAGESFVPTADTSLNAIYSRQTVLYTVRFLDADGQVIAQKQYPRGAMPEAPDMSQYVTEDGATFGGWDSQPEPVSEDRDYTVVLLPAPTYTIRFVGRDGDVKLVLECRRGEIPQPPAAADMLLDDGSIFLGWDKEITAATADVDYIAQYQDRIPQGEDDPLPTPPQTPEQDPQKRQDTITVLLALGGVVLLIGALFFIYYMNKNRDV
jgi:hypothetical protein